MRLFLFLLAALAICLILYWILRAAVRDGTIAAAEYLEKRDDPAWIGDPVIGQITCQHCQKQIDADVPKCPHCGGNNSFAGKQ